MLTLEQQRRHLRHLLLAEIGEAGQARLCCAQVTTRPGASARAAAIALEYVERAGVEQGSSAATAFELAIVDDAQVDRLAGTPLLREAAAALVGAFAATETIKRIVGAGRAAHVPVDLVLDEGPT